MVEIEQRGETSLEPKAELRKSVVDTLFDALTLRAAKGLVTAKDVFESLARWFDARAKVAGELAIRLSAPSPSTSADTPSRTTST